MTLTEQHKPQVSTLALVLFACFTGCDSIDFARNDSQIDSPSKSEEGRFFTAYTFANERVYFSFLDTKDDLSPMIKSSSDLTQTLLCSGPFLDSSSYVATYKGMSVKYPYGYPYKGTDPVSLTFIYQIEVAGNLDHNNSLGTIQIPDSGWPAHYPATVQTAFPDWSLLSTHYDSLLGTDVNVYRVSFSISMTYQPFCQYWQFRSKLKLNTDCSDIGVFTTNYTSFYTLTPATYATYWPYADNGISAGSIQVPIDFCLCFDPCHFPSLGHATKYIFEYRNLTRGGSWQSTTLVFGPNVISGLISGDTYEYRSKGLLSLPDIYDDFSPVRTIVPY